MKIYENLDSLSVKKEKSKEIILKYPDESFDLANASLTARVYNNQIIATCPEGDQCCFFDWESVDEFLKDYVLNQYQDIEEEI